ncbi:unnamed protein product, partial [Ectocarpus sp. 13 AM-2016]
RFQLLLRPEQARHERRKSRGHGTKRRSEAPRACGGLGLERGPQHYRAGGVGSSKAGLQCGQRRRDGQGWRFGRSQARLRRGGLCGEPKRGGGAPLRLGGAVRE